MAALGRRVGEHAIAFVRYALVALFTFTGVLLAWYVETRPVNMAVPWPTWEVLTDSVFKDRAVALADVGWGVGAVMNGYERIPEGVADPYATQHNWAYFPLTIWLGKLMTFVTRDAFWALEMLAIVSVAGLLTLARHMRRTWKAPEGFSFAHELVVLFFVLPISWPCPNFMVLPMLLEYGLFFALLRLFEGLPSGSKSERAPSLSPWSTGLVLFLALLFAFARPQGLAIVALVSVSVALILRATPLRARVLLAVGGLASVALVLVYYKVVVGDALAWYHVQRAWGRTSTMPWTPWIQEIASGFPVGEYMSFVVIGLRVLVTSAGLAYAARAVVRDFVKGDRRPRLLLEASLLGVSFVLLVQPFTTGTLLGAHRLLCFAMLPFFLPPDRNIVARMGPLSVIGLVTVRMLEMAFFLQNARFATW